jgi:hypothetical protein
MGPYIFDFPDTDSDAILRSLDGKEFHVHRLILSLASPVFDYMFSLPQPTDIPSKTPTIDVSESSDILQPFLQYLYPRSPPNVSDLPMWEALYTTADKYTVEVVMDHLRDMLLHQFLETSPLRVYSIASHWGFEEIAKTASTRTLAIDIFKDLERQDAELMGGGACQQLYLLHLHRREAAREVVANHPLPSASCGCPIPNYSGVVPALCRLVSTKPWLTAEELYENASKFHYPVCCADKGSCRNAFQNVTKYFTSILKGVSELPKTI